MLLSSSPGVPGESRDGIVDSSSNASFLRAGSVIPGFLYVDLFAEQIDNGSRDSWATQRVICEYRSGAAPLGIAMKVGGMLLSMLPFVSLFFIPSLLKGIRRLLKLGALCFAG